MDELDKALVILKNYGPEFRGGLSNHGPMVAETLVTLKHYDKIIPWIENYKDRLEEHPKTKKPITSENSLNELSNYGRLGDWIAFFNQELKQSSLSIVLSDWIPRLIPGLLAAATHGLIRTAHAIRSIQRSESRERFDELAEALGYWAARYQFIPDAKLEPKDPKGLLPSEAIKKINTIPVDKQLKSGLIMDAINELNNYPAFFKIINFIDTSIDPFFIISNLTETAAQLFLANATSVRNMIAFVHGVTAVSALRILIPHIPPGSIKIALSRGWQAVAAIYAALGQSREPKIIEVPDGGIKNLIDRAVATKQEHVIKFTDACLREYLMNPKNVYLAAANYAILNLK